MDRKQKDGSTLRQHLTSAYRQTGKMPKQLEPLEFPEMLANVWGWFIDINDGRTCGDMGSNPLTWQDIAAWSDLMNVHLDPREVKVIKQLDNLLFKTK